MSSFENCPFSMRARIVQAMASGKNILGSHSGINGARRINSKRNMAPHIKVAFECSESPIVSKLDFKKYRPGNGPPKNVPNAPCAGE